MDSKIKELRENLEKMASMKHKYGLTASSIETYIKDTEHFQVVTPLIGEFSTGKSCKNTMRYCRSWGNIAI